jgi:hypothetical protein
VRYLDEAVVEEEADGGADRPDVGIHLLLHHAAHNGFQVGAGVSVVVRRQVGRAELRGDGQSEQHHKRQRRPRHFFALAKC